MKEPFYKYAMETTVLYNFIASMEIGCDRCTLPSVNKKPIVYRGNPEAQILLIGDDLANKENLPVSQLLDNMMKSIDFSAETNMCIANSIYCQSIDPDLFNKEKYISKGDQINICTPFTHKLIQNIIKPKIIIASGKVALQQLTKDKDTCLEEWEGKWTTYKYNFKSSSESIDSSAEEIPMFTIVHPASLIEKGIKDSKKYIAHKKQVWLYLQELKASWKEKAYGLNI